MFCVNDVFIGRIRSIRSDDVENIEELLLVDENESGVDVMDDSFGFDFGVA